MPEDYALAYRDGGTDRWDFITLGDAELRYTGGSRTTPGAATLADVSEWSDGGTAWQDAFGRERQALAESAAENMMSDTDTIRELIGDDGNEHWLEDWELIPLKRGRQSPLELRRAVREGIGGENVKLGFPWLEPYHVRYAEHTADYLDSEVEKFRTRREAEKRFEDLHFVEPRVEPGSRRGRSVADTLVGGVTDTIGSPYANVRLIHHAADKEEYSFGVGRGGDWVLGEQDEIGDEAWRVWTMRSSAAFDKATRELDEMSSNQRQEMFGIGQRTPLEKQLDENHTIADALQAAADVSEPDDSEQRRGGGEYAMSLLSERQMGELEEKVPWTFDGGVMGPMDTGASEEEEASMVREAVFEVLTEKQVGEFDEWLRQRRRPNGLLPLAQYSVAISANGDFSSSDDWTPAARNFTIRGEGNADALSETLSEATDRNFEEIRIGGVTSFSSTWDNESVLDGGSPVELNFNYPGHPMNAGFSVDGDVQDSGVDWDHIDDEVLREDKRPLEVAENWAVARLFDRGDWDKSRFKTPTEYIRWFASKSDDADYEKFLEDIIWNRHGMLTPDEARGIVGAGGTVWIAGGTDTADYGGPHYPIEDPDDLETRLFESMFGGADGDAPRDFAAKWLRPGVPARMPELLADGTDTGSADLETIERWKEIHSDWTPEMPEWGYSQFGKMDAWSAVETIDEHTESLSEPAARWKPDARRTFVPPPKRGTPEGNRDFKHWSAPRLATDERGQTYLKGEYRRIINNLEYQTSGEHRVWRSKRDAQAVAESSRHIGFLVRTIPVKGGWVNIGRGGRRG
jgi:hypothetical protein